MTKVFELAAQVGVSAKEMIALLNRIGSNVTHHRHTVEDAHVVQVLKPSKSLQPKLSRQAAKQVASSEKHEAIKVPRTGVSKKDAPTIGRQDAAPTESSTTGKKSTAVADVLSRAKSKTATDSQRRRISRVSAPPLPSVPEKKSHVLIKKKVVPVEDVPTVVVSAPGFLESSPPVEAVQVEPSTDMAKVQPTPTGESGGSVETSQKTKPAVSRFDFDAEWSEKKRQPWGRMETRPAPRRDRGRRDKRITWQSADTTSTVEPTEDVGGSDVLPGAVGVPSDLRKWQDFKPIHRKDDRRKTRHGRTATVEPPRPRRSLIKLYEGLTVKEFSELTGQKVSVIIGKLIELGKMATINQPIALDEATLIAEEFGIKVTAVAEKSEEEILTAPPSDPANRISRPPVVTIMGHVDHGKTSLLDAIRRTKVTEGEAGGITQHIGAYTVTVHDKQITFLDTPGHEAFTAMRARGAKVTDIVVLVVAADDGVMQQTIEAINHAKAANVPVIVAINKIDKPEAHVERIKGALGAYDLIPEEWGGQTIFTEVSAKQKLGLDHLLEMILLQAEVMDMKADPDRMAVGAVIEAKIDRGRGPVASVLIREGTLRGGDVFVAGVCYGKVRALVNDEGKTVSSAGPSVPVEVIGIEGVPLAGDTFVVVADEQTARAVAMARMEKKRVAEATHTPRVALDDLSRIVAGDVAKVFNLIIKADVQGSVEAIRESLEKIASTSVKLNILHRGVGGITESDVLLASASGAVVIGFNVRPAPAVQGLADAQGVDIRLYTIIYDALADVRAAMAGLLDPTLKEETLGRMEVRKLFSIPTRGTIAGGYVIYGTVTRNNTGLRLIRDQVVVHEGTMGSLRRFKDDVKEVQSGYECGIGIEKFNDIKVGDIIEVYTHHKIAAVL